ncbi:hypothetical protein GKIL_3866 [Gloeobacter kilaueensis JS1]|uniref:Uncharacterized protein n=1 Tax=Gloeobacter kilaueensis (strain ATCC BAA-2537 / CCAP 1431/1 / ULC 316 / JS1) TaxID=1183438 RepID=U5QM96_GLOK1|nr:hypothetical protein GKIL_3866 [Gloeobacter kilaueensis JS1]
MLFRIFIDQSGGAVPRRIRLDYLKSDSSQTLREGLEEYYAAHPNLTDPRQLDAAFARIILAHDASHVIYGCDTGMYDELKLLPLTWWTSDYHFSDHLRTLRDPAIGPAVKIMYDDLIKEHGSLWLYSSMLLVLPKLVPELIRLWWRNRGRGRFVPFLAFEPLLDRSLVEIRREFDLLPLMARRPG